MTRRIAYARKLLADALLWGSAPLLAYLFRFDGAIPATMLPGLVALVLGGLAIKLVALFAFGLHRQSWKHASFRDTVVVVRAVFVVGVAEIAFGLVIAALLPLPRSVLPLSVLLGALFMFGVRALRRAAHQWQLRRRGLPIADGARNALIVGGGEAGYLVVREMQRHPDAGLLPGAIVDDDPSKHALSLDGVQVVGPLDEIPALLREGSFAEVVIAIGSADGALIRRVRSLVAEADPEMPVRVVPGLYEVLSGDVNVSRLRLVQVEDLLRRPPVPIDRLSVREYVAGRTVLVTGAGGSIGSELVRQLVRCGPERVIALGHGENSIFELQQDLARLGNRVPVVPLIASVRDRERLRVAFERYEPEVVFHAAAHKHLPLMEANPEQAVFTNVGGTRNVVEVALEAGAERFVNISTDKAVNPASALGASKRLAERLVRQAALRAAPEQRFVTVRFGNVLGSRGSAVRVFREQIERGGPVTVTDPRMTRYFMTIPEACQLVLQAASFGQNGITYLLDMGQPVRILDLAHDMIRLSGLRPDDDVHIVFTGVRPGEKLHEELLIDSEDSLPTPHPHVRAAVAEDVDGPALRATLATLFEAAHRGQQERVRAMLVEVGRSVVSAD